MATEDTESMCVYSGFFRVLPWLFMLYIKDDFPSSKCRSVLTLYFQTAMT